MCGSPEGGPLAVAAELTRSRRLCFHFSTVHQHLPAVAPRQPRAFQRTAEADTLTVPEEQERAARRRRQFGALINRPRCRVCHKTFLNLGQARAHFAGRRHARAVAESAGPHECRTCSRVFDSPHNLAVHLRSRGHRRAEVRRAEIDAAASASVSPEQE